MSFSAPMGAGRARKPVPYQQEIEDCTRLIMQTLNRTPGVWPTKAASVPSSGCNPTRRCPQGTVRQGPRTSGGADQLCLRAYRNPGRN
jgi:hypothetical protein